jgi:Probable transposase
VGSDVGLKAFLTDSDGATVANPQDLRKVQRRVSRQSKGSRSRRKAVHQLSKGSLQVHSQRQDFACNTAKTLIPSHDVVAYDDVKIANAVKHRHRAKRISDAAGGIFLGWLRYSSGIAPVPEIAVPPAFPAQDSSGIRTDGTPCQTRVKKSLSVRTPICPQCGLVLWAGPVGRCWTAITTLRATCWRRRRRSPLCHERREPYRRAGGNGRSAECERFGTDRRYGVSGDGGAARGLVERRICRFQPGECQAENTCPAKSAAIRFRCPDHGLLQGG